MNPRDQQREGAEQPTQGGKGMQGGQSTGGGQGMRGGQSAAGGQPKELARAQGQPVGQPGTDQGGTAATPIGEMSVDSPTLRWVSIERPGASVPIGPDDYVLESVFNPGIDAWEVLVLVEPREAEEDEDEDEAD